MQLEAKRAIITGATKGIGLAVAEALVDEGASVWICARNARDVSRTVGELSARAPQRVDGGACDVQQSDQVQALIESCVARFGGLDILVNNAGVGIFKSVERLEPEEWRRTLATNLDSIFYASHWALPHLKRSGGGFIINIGSLAGKNAFPGGAAYNASKFGLIGFSEALMQEVRHDDIRVAYVMPGSVDTWFGGHAPEQSNWKLSAQDVAEVVIETLRRHPRCLTSRIEMRPAKPPKK